MAAASAQEKLDREPELHPDEELTLRWFSKVSKRRPPSDWSPVPKPIPTTELEAFHRLMKLEEVIEAEDFLDVMDFLDSALIEYYIEQEEAKQRRVAKPN